MSLNKSNKPKTIKASQENICPYCGQLSQTLFVHGHEQCILCKTNVEPCCQGAVQEVNLTDNFSQHINYKHFSLIKIGSIMQKKRIK